MTIPSRSTLVIHGRLAMRESRLAAARNARHGLQVMSFEQAAVGIALVGVSAMAAQPATTDRAEQVRESYASAMQNAQETQA